MSIYSRGIFPGPKIAAWFMSISIRLTCKPFLECRNWVVSPDKRFSLRVSLQCQPNLTQWRSALVNQLQYKLVFFFTVDLHQISSQFFAEGLGLVPSLDGVAHQVTVAFKIRSATGTRTFSVKKRWLFLWTLLELFLRFLLCLVHDQKVSSP